MKIQDLKERYSCHDVAEALGLDRPGGKGNYKSPHHDDKSPSLSVSKDGKTFKDWSMGNDESASGSIIDLVMFVEDITDVGDAVKRLHELLNIPPDPPSNDNSHPQRQKSTAEYVAEKCFDDLEPARKYLIEERKIPEEIVDRAIKRKAVGFNDWHSDKVEPGKPLYGGPAVAFIVRDINQNQVVAVDTRYLDPELNGGVKTQCLGEKFGAPFTTCRKTLDKAKKVFIVESPINALSAEAAEIPYTAAVATRGTGNVENIDWRFLCGKSVVICMDHDKPDEKTGRCAGQEAAWSLYEKLTALNISCLLVDQLHWKEQGWNDLNDVLKAGGPEEVKKVLGKLEQWIIPGLPGHGDPDVRDALEAHGTVGKSRIWLPAHDFMDYWHFRAKDDFVNFVSLGEKDENGNQQRNFKSVCGFRVAGISRVRIAGTTSIMTGEKDTSTTTIFAVSVQTPRHGPELQRKVFEDERLHNIDMWKKFGPVYSPGVFSRMINIMERSAHLGARDAVNFVGLAWQDGRMIVNEGPDCYFSDPDKQCPYHNLKFPSGPVSNAAVVINAYQRTFKKNAALQLLSWSLGGHLKAFLGFWPHMMIQADKGAGKSTLIKRLERTIGFTMFSGQSIQTEFRLLTSISSTSHPVGWEELSARSQQIIDKAVNLLQENYQYTVTRRGTDMTEYVLTAPVLLAGEDVPVQSLLGKIIRTELTGRKGDILPANLPVFPVLEWLQWLAGLNRNRVTDLYQEVNAYVMDHCMAAGDDDGAVRMAGNYAAMITAWRLLTEFAGIAKDQGRFLQDALETMNDHVAETSGDREPWVWITEIVLSEIDRGEFRFPYQFDTVQTKGPHVVDKEVLLVRPSHIMDHIAHTPALRDRHNGLPVKSARIYSRQLRQAGVLLMENGQPIPNERTIHGRRVSNMVAMDLEALATFGLHASPKVVTVHEG